MENAGLVKKAIFCIFARRFVAGEKTEDAVKKARELAEKRINSAINILGEDIIDPSEALRIFSQYKELILILAREHLWHCHISIKPSQLGLAVSEELFREYLLELLKTAKIFLPDSLIEIDAEHQSDTVKVRRVCVKLAREGYLNMRVARQANFAGTPWALKESVEIGISDRLCKGAYSGDIKGKKEIQERFLTQALFLLKNGKMPVLATHDLRIIGRFKKEKNLEFQVLLGIENKEMERLAEEGTKVRFYIPCGPNWWPYGKRRAKTILRIWLRNFFYRLKGR